MKSLQKLSDIECFDEAFKNINRKISSNSLLLEGFCNEIVLGNCRKNNDTRVLKKYAAKERFKDFICREANLDFDNVEKNVEQEKLFVFLLSAIAKAQNLPVQ